MAYLTCRYCGATYMVSDRDRRFGQTLQGLMWHVLFRSGEPLPVTCLGHNGAVARSGYAACYRWNVPRKEIEVLVIPSRDAKRGVFWQLGLVLWHVEEDEHGD
jgi:hypothetical protein